MEQLPVEVIGNILSHLRAARDVVIASATCRKWRLACCKHLHTLSFSSNDWPIYRDLTTTRLEILITQTIFQTSGLQALSILMEDVDEFSASTVIAWLMYTRETLRQLFYNVKTVPNVNILEICGRHKLQILDLAHNSIVGVEPNYQRFPCLKSLSLSYVSISALDLNLLVSACPKIEALELVNPEIAMSDAQVTVELSSSTLKSVYVEAISLDKFILEADGIQSLHLKDCALEVFELIGKGTLKHFRIDDVSVIHLDIGETVENLESVDISNFTIIWPKFYQMISRSSNLKRLRLWDVMFDDEDEVVDLETIATCFPGMNQSTVSQITWRFVEAMEERGLCHLSWPSSEMAMEEIKSKFKNIRGLPNCCGAVDSTHIMMTLPSVESLSNVWLDREKNCSMVLQAIVDPDLRFRDIVTGWPGSLSDNHVLRSSAFFKLVEEGKRLNGGKKVLPEGTTLREYIVGDTGFPLLPWLLTPYEGEGLSNVQVEYNKRVAATQMVAKRALARLKGMWKIVQGVMWKPDKHRLPRIILVCCILHNIVIDLEDEVQDHMPLCHQHDSGYQDQTCEFADSTANTMRDKLSLYLSGKVPT